MKKALLFLLAASALVVWHMSSDTKFEPLLLRGVRIVAQAGRLTLGVVV